MIGWWKCPSGLACDPRFASLSLDAGGLLLRLLDAADGTGEVKTGTMEALDAAAALSGGAARDRVAAAFSDLLGVGILSESDGALVIDFRWPEEARPSPNPAPRPSEPASASPARPAAEVDRRTATKRLAAQWSKRGLKDADARTRWLSSEAGRSYLDASNISLALATAIATGDVSEAVSGVSAGVSDGVSADSGGVSGAVSGVSAAGFPPVPPSGERDGENSEKPRHQTPARDVSASVSASVSTRVSADTSGVSGGGGEVPDQEFIFGLARESDGHFVTSGGSDQVDAVAAVFAESGVDREALLSALRRPTDALPGVKMVAAGNIVSVAMLAGKYDGSGFPCTLARSLVAYARAQAAPVESTSTIPDAEETMAREKALRLRREAIRNGPPLVVPPLNLRRAPASTTTTATASEVRDG